MKNIYLSLTAFVCLLWSCNKPEMIPSYLSIQKVEVLGFPDHKILQVWVYANNSFLGAFPLPAEIPVLESGDVKFQVFPGVLENGDYQTPNIYPILTRFSTTANMEAGKTTVVQPVMEYEPAATTSFFEDFEPNSQRFLVEEIDGDLITKLELVSVGALPASISAKVNLDTSHRIFEIWSLPITDLPINNRPVWLEFSYKTDMEFRIGLAGASSLGGVDNVSYFQSVFPKSAWTKMYLNLTEVISTSKFPQYKIAFRALLPTDAQGKPSVLNSTMWLDNIRLVYLK